MKLKKYLFSIISLVILSAGMITLILTNYNPYDNDAITVGTFFSSLLVFLSGIFTLIFFYIRIKISNNEVIYSNLPISIRHGLLLAIVIDGLIIFNSMKLLTWLIGLMFVSVIILIELFFHEKRI